MINPINRRIFRIFTKRAGNYIPIFLASIIFISIFSSFFISQNSVEPIYYSSLKDLNVEDGNFTVLNPLKHNELKEISQFGSKVYENFYKEEKFNLENEKDYKNLMRVYTVRENINLQSVVKGNLPKNADEIAIGNSMAIVRKIKINDTLNFKNKNFKVVGFIATPDYSTILKNQNDFVMDTEHFGIAVVSKDGFDSLNENTVFNYAYKNDTVLNEKKSHDRLVKIVTHISKENRVENAVDFYNNQCIQYLIKDMGGDVPMMLAVLIIIFISLSFITSIQTKSLIEEEAPTIGTLLSLGYKSKTLTLHYLLIPTILITIAALFGNLLAYFYGYKIYAYLYYTSYNLPKFVPIFSFKSFFITSLIPITIVIIINLIILAKYFRLNPLNFLRKNLNKKSKRHFLKLENTSFLKSIKLRVLTHNYLNVIVLFIGVFVANLLLIYGISMKTIFTNYADNVKSEMKYNYIYLVKAPVNDLKETKGTIATLKYKDKDLEFFGLDNNSKYSEIDDLKDGEIIASNALMEKHNLNLGDEIKIYVPWLDKIKTVKIAKIYNNVSSIKAFTKIATLNKIIEKDANYLNAYLSDKNHEIPKEILISKIDKEKNGEYLKNFIDKFGTVFNGMLVLSVCFYLVMVYTVSKLIIDKSRLNISYLKIFGYHDREISNIYLSTIKIALIIFLIATVPIVNTLATKIFTLATSKLDIYINPKFESLTFVKIIVVDIVIYSIIQLLQKIKLNKSDMARELKNING